MIKTNLVMYRVDERTRSLLQTWVIFVKVVFTEISYGP